MQVYGSDQAVLAKALEWLQHGAEVALVTVLKTWGSSPRPPGSLLVMQRDGSHYGSVSGGCVEEDLLQRYRDYQLDENLPTRIDYGVNRAEATRFGLPCGGRLELLVEQLSDIDQLQQVLDAFEKKLLITRQVDLHSGRVLLQSATADESFIYSSVFVRQVFGPQWNILLIGAAQLSEYVSHMAMMLGYRVTVCEPREDVAKNWQLAGTELTTLMPDDAVIKFARQPRSIVLALTHDPKLDDMALLDALISPAFYVGAIGSQRNCEARRERLKAMGLTASQLLRLHAPVGLSIGSHTPAEIAVSIMAEITQLRNQSQQPVEQTLEKSAKLV